MLSERSRDRLVALSRLWASRTHDRLGAMSLDEFSAGLLEDGSTYSGGLGKHRQSTLAALSEQSRAIACCHAIALAMSRYASARLAYRVPSTLHAVREFEFERILARIAREGLTQCDLREDSWKKDWMIATGALVPAGASLFDPHSGIPRRVLLRKGIAQLVSGLRAIVDCGGHRPMAELHTHTESLAEFNPAGWQRTYLRLADFLESNPGIRGVTGTAWFRDPQLHRVSPQLDYLRAMPTEGGARFLFIARDAAGTSGALARSATRRSLFEAGAYVPEMHLMIWPRQRLLDWARRQRQR